MNKNKSNTKSNRVLLSYDNVRPGCRPLMVCGFALLTPVLDYRENMNEYKTARLLVKDNRPLENNSKDPLYTHYKGSLIPFKESNTSRLLVLVSLSKPIMFEFDLRQESLLYSRGLLEYP